MIWRQRRTCTSPQPVRHSREPRGADFVTSQPPSQPGGNEYGSMPPYASGGAPTARNSGLSIASLVLGIVLGAIGLRQARAGRAGRRGLALAGLIAGVIGLVLSVVVFAYALKRTQACQDRIGHAPSRAELEQCIR